MKSLFSLYIFLSFICKFVNGKKPETNRFVAYATLNNINYSTAIFIENNTLKILLEEFKLLNE